ncbi:hypothetical protein CapIbe_022182 [Capra ibex]
MERKPLSPDVYGGIVMAPQRAVGDYKQLPVWIIITWNSASPWQLMVGTGWMGVEEAEVSCPAAPQGHSLCRCVVHKI